MNEVWGWLAAVLDAVGRAMTFDPTLLAEAADPAYLSVAVGVALLAGAMTMLGHSVILFVNGVHGWRFALALLVTGVWTVFLYALQGVVVGVLGHILLDRDPGSAAMLAAVLLATAPLCLGFLILIPYSGPFIGRLLEIWSFLVLVAAVAVLFAVSVWGALLLTGAGWLVRQAVARLVAGPFGWLGRRVGRLLTGRPVLITSHDVLAGHPFLDVVGGRAP